MVTMAQVAAAAGVSVSTVSHVVNNTRPVSPALRERVERAVAASGYSPNIVARSLATQNTKLIGVVMSFLSNPFFGPLVSSIEGTAARRGYTLLLTDSREAGRHEATQISVMLDRRVDGVILAPAADSSSDMHDLLVRRRVPTVLIDRFADRRFDEVGVENVESTATLVTHLADLGHTRIAFIRGQHGLSTTNERMQGYRLGLEKAGLRYDRRLVRSGNSEDEPAREAVKSLLESRNRPTAVIPANNAMTMGVLRGLRDVGARVPRDIAVAAFDDIGWADLLDPGLTAIAQPIAEMGEIAVRLLLRRIGGHDGPPVRRILPATFQHRNSCGCAIQQEPAGTGLSLALS